MKTDTKKPKIKKEEKVVKVKKIEKQPAKAEKIEKPTEKVEQKPTKSKYWHGTGRRKSAIAQVRIFNDPKDFVVNEMDAKSYFPTPVEMERALYPLKLTGNDQMGVSAKVSGGGKVAQADAVRLGVARALMRMDENLKTTLRRSGLLTRDPREKERKKYGLKSARRAPQWAKR